jgi:hypothetical protein
VAARGGLEDELRQLRRGEGINAADLRARVGPALGRLAGVTPEDTAPEIRRRLIDWVDDSSARLDRESRLAARSALALPPEGRGRFLADRLAWLAAELRCDPRTARRKVDRAFRLLATAQPAGTGAEGGGPGWFVASFTALLRMDLEPPEALELRRVVSTVDGLSEITTAVGVPRHPGDQGEDHDLRIEVLHGGRLERREQPYESYFRYVIALAEPLPAGVEHEYVIRMTTPAGQPMHPHYVHVPSVRTDHFALRARFHAGAAPRSIWRLTGVPPVAIYDPEPGRDRVETDRFGQLRCDFHRLAPGHGYGIRWPE